MKLTHRLLIGLSRHLLLLFIIVPILEIYLLITVGRSIGVLPTVSLVILTAIVGTYLLRVQGLATLQTVQTTLAQGQVPTEALLEGIFLLVGGALLLTPGFFTDALGFLCLIPAPRRYVIRELSQSLFSPPPQKGPYTIEGEYTREDD